MDFSGRVLRGYIVGRRYRGRQRRTWADDLKKMVKRKAKNKTLCRSMVANLLDTWWWWNEIAYDVKRFTFFPENILRLFNEITWNFEYYDTSWNLTSLSLVFTSDINISTTMYPSAVSTSSWFVDSFLLGKYKEEEQVLHEVLTARAYVLVLVFMSLVKTRLYIKIAMPH